jgi:hypothetical protein
MSAENNSVEIGLKTEIKRQVGLKNFQHNVGTHAQAHMVEAWKVLLKSGLTDEVSKMIWDYALSSPSAIWVRTNSANLGIYSIIGEYENKKGFKSMAHFTENRNYIGSVAKLGNEPIGYEGRFRLSKSTFKLDITLLNELTMINGSYDLSELFIPSVVV